MQGMSSWTGGRLLLSPDLGPKGHALSHHAGSLAHLEAHRNVITFDGTQLSLSSLLDIIRTEAVHWATASTGGLAVMLPGLLVWLAFSGVVL